MIQFNKHIIYPRNPHPQSLAALILLHHNYTPIPNSVRFWLRYRKHILKLWRRKGKFYCFYCGKGPLKKEIYPSKKTNYINLATLDHVVPVSKGGEEYSEKNLLLACGFCNNKKGNKNFNDFYKIK